MVLIQGSIVSYVRERRQNGGSSGGGGSGDLCVYIGGGVLGGVELARKSAVGSFLL